MSEYAVMPLADYQAACDKIREKTGKTETIKSGAMAAEIDSIQIGTPAPVVEPLSVTANGTYNPPEGVDGYSPVTVSVARDDQTDIEEQFIRAIERDESKPLTKLPDGLTKIGGYAFYYNMDIALTSLPDGVTSIGNNAFSECTNLVLTSLSDGLTSIGNNAFSGCTNLALTSLPDGLTILFDHAFTNCTSLALTSLPAGVTRIGRSAFNNCTNLKEITFNGKPTYIYDSAFNNCTNLLTINVPWAEGEVKNAPWGATNATINYNYTGG